MTTTQGDADATTTVYLPTELELPPAVASAEGIRWPTDLDLPYGDDEPIESDRHATQIELLKECLRLHWATRERWFVGGNMFVYFARDQRLTYDYRGPDVFVVLDVERRERRSWVVWEEGKGPDVVIELLSDTTAANDRGEKKRVYQDRLRVPEYYWYHPFTEELAGWRLEGGVYVPIPPDVLGAITSPTLDLKLAVWRGEYARIEAPWLRWTTLDGELLPTGEEWAEQERARADAAEQRLEAALRRLAELESRLTGPALDAEV